jgi:phosphohistidine phosphatase SixA
MPPHSRTRRRLLLASATLLGWAQARAQSGAGAFWAAVQQPGAVVLMRHAQTEPGVGDPPGFRLDICSSQRNLSDAGRAQARRVAAAFAAAGVVAGDVRSSAWCRCVDTARLAFGQATVWPAINSTFQGQGDPDRGRAEVLAAARAWRGPGPLVLVTHQVNISHITGEFTAMGDMLAARVADGRMQVLARLSA